MKAFRITSEEYYRNQVRTFLFVDGQYYGDIIYPQLRNMPQDVDYWRTATSSDSDRYFYVEEVEVSEDQTKKLQALHEQWESAAGNVMNTQPWKPGMAKEESEAMRQENIKIEDRNRPFYRAIDAARNEIEKIIKSL